MITSQLFISKEKKKGFICQRNQLSCSADTSPKREAISNVGNLKGSSCRRSYTLWKNDLDGLISNSQFVRERAIERERNWQPIDACFCSYHSCFFPPFWISVFFFLFFFVYSIFFSFFLSLCFPDCRCSSSPIYNYSLLYCLS